MRNWLLSQKPRHLLIYGYLTIICGGFLLLCVPWMQQVPVSVLDNLFIATSALSTTGLATLNVSSSYNFAGELIILLLVQIGGLGYMSVGSFVVFMRKRKLDSLNQDMLKSDFSLPDDFSIPSFVRSLILFTVYIELIGAMLLTLIFWQNGEANPVWLGIFHSVSAFCTAGFSLFNDSFTGYRNNFYLNAVISALSIAGAVGFIVFTDLYDRFRGRKKSITFTSRIILRFTFLGILIGTAIIFLSDPAIARFKPEERLLSSFFQSMTAFTTVGFNSYDIGSIAAAPLFFMLLLMIMGASPAGTGGGMKSTTLTALYAQLKSTFHGNKDVLYMNCKIPEHRVSTAVSNFFFYVLVICVGTYFLLLLEDKDTFAVLFEAVSALGTVGLSMGITGELSSLGKICIIVLMFLGRIGPLSFGIALFGQKTDNVDANEEDIAI